MDRFSIYLLGALAVVLIALGGTAYIRHHEVADVAAEASTDAKIVATPPPATPAPLFGTSADKMPMSAALGNANIISSTPDMSSSPSMPIMGTPPPMMAMASSTPSPWSPPNYGATTTVVYPGFTIVYSSLLGNPAAVQYAMVQGAKPKRYPQPAKVQTPDPRLIRSAGYAAGTMAFPASINLYFGKSSGVNTSLMPNLCAFNPATLSGPWSKLAQMEVQYSSAYKWIEIVTGPIFVSPPTNAGGLIVPSAFYRVYRRSYGDCLAFIIPQGASSTKMESYLTSVSAVEAATGLPLFGNTLPQDQRDQIPTAVW